MKKVYQVPEVECISLVSEEDVTIMPINDVIDGNIGIESAGGFFN